MAAALNPDLVYLLIPETPREKLWAVLIVSPTAAFCEEFLFRGYLLTQFHDWLHSLLWAWVVSSVAFGLAHFYQGWSGMIRAGLLGALLAYPVVRWGNLYPAMLAHWMIDTVALLWLGSWMMGKEVSGVRSPQSESRNPDSAPYRAGLPTLDSGLAFTRRRPKPARTCERCRLLPSVLPPPTCRQSSGSGYQDIWGNSQ